MSKPKKTKPFKLTLATYFDKNRPHMSVSQINDYLRSPEYFYKKHVAKSIPRKAPTSPMKVGSYVDACLTNPKVAKKYQQKFERTCYAKDDRETYDEETAIIEAQKQFGEDYVLTDTEWMKGVQLVEFIKSQPFWQNGLQKAVMQQPMEMTLNGHLLCGLPDRMDWIRGAEFGEGEGAYAEPDALHISDLKMSSFIKTSTPAKWFYNAREMGYIRQFAMYRWLAHVTFNVPKENMRFSHMVGIWHEDGLVDAKLYTFPKYEIDKAERELVAALEQIAKKNFGRKLLSWDDAIDLSRIDGVVEAMEEDDEDDSNE